MSDFIWTQLLPALLSNTCVGLILLAIALSVRLIGNRPHLEHLLWLLLLAKLITPPVINLPVLSYDRPVLAFIKTTSVSSAANTPSAFDVPITATKPDFPINLDKHFLQNAPRASVKIQNPASDPELAAKVATKSKFIAASIPAISRSASRRTSVTVFPYNIQLDAILFSAWLIGSIVVLCWSFIRLIRFQKLLRVTSEDAPKGIALRFDSVASRLGVRSTPELLIVSSRISPFVWWMGGKTQVYVPQTLIESLSQAELNQVFAHELAHIRRRDHLVRWLELASTVLLWWNPLVWICQRYLRSAEEACCDEMVLSSLDVSPQDYGATLLLSVESLMDLENRPPAIASGINSGGSLERRIKMILSSTSPRRHSLSSKFILASVVMAIVPLGFVTAQSPDKATSTKDSSPATVLPRANRSISTQPAPTVLLTIDSMPANKTRAESSNPNDSTSLSSVTSQDALPSSTKVSAKKPLERQDSIWEEVPSRVVSAIRPPTSDETSWLREHLSIAVEKGKITELQMQLMIDSLSESAAAKPHPLKRLYNAANYFSATALRLNAAFNRVQSTSEEVEHFKRLSNIGIESLDVALDSQRRHFQSEIAFAMLLLEIHKSHEDLKKQIEKSVSTNKLDDLTAHTMTVEHKKQMLEIIEKLGPRFQYYVEKTQLWLAKEQVAKAVRARALALETWRIVQDQHKNGADVTVQHVAQASEQYHYFNGAVTEAMNVLATEKTKVE